MLSMLFHLSKPGPQKVVQSWCLLFKQKHLQATKCTHSWGKHCEKSMVASQAYRQESNAWWDWETNTQRTAGFLNIHLELEKHREFCHYFMNTTGFIWDHSEGRVQSSMAGTDTEMLGCFPRAAPDVTATGRTDSSSGRREHKAQLWISETGLKFLTHIVN